MNETVHRVRVVYKCAVDHEHPLCVTAPRGVPPELRCPPEAPPGYRDGGGGGCAVPTDLADRVARELRDNFQNSKRQGLVLVRT